MRYLLLLILLLILSGCSVMKEVGQQERVTFPSVWRAIGEDPRDAPWDPDYANGEDLFTPRKLRWVKVQ